MHIKVKVWAEAGSEKIIKKDNGSFEVFVRQPAKAGVANRRVKQLLSETIQVPAHRLRLVSGFQRPNKIFEIIPERGV